MDVAMGDGLSCYGTSVHPDVEPFDGRIVRHHVLTKLPEQFVAGQKLMARQTEVVLNVTFGDHQGMASGHREPIEDGEGEVVAANDPLPRNRAEKAVSGSHLAVAPGTTQSGLFNRKSNPAVAFTDIERARNLASLKWFLERRRPPEHIRAKLDIGYAVEGHAVDIFEIRPDWQDKTETRHSPVARIKYVRSADEWRLYWMRRDLKWHSYEPSATHSSLKAALAVVDADAYCCFFG